MIFQNNRLKTENIDFKYRNKILKTKDYTFYGIKIMCNGDLIQSSEELVKNQERFYFLSSHIQDL